MIPRERHYLGLPTEKTYGYCRALKVEGRIWVSGTTAMAAGGGVLPAHLGDAYAQSIESFRRIGPYVFVHAGLPGGRSAAVRRAGRAPGGVIPPEVRRDSQSSLPKSAIDPYLNEKAAEL